MYEVAPANVTGALDQVTVPVYSSVAVTVVIGVALFTGAIAPATTGFLTTSVQTGPAESWKMPPSAPRTRSFSPLVTATWPTPTA